MKTTKITYLILAIAMLTGGCTSSYQASGGVAGAMIGGQIGEAIGFLSGHGPFRGRSAALGNLVGMGVGAALGIGITSQIESNEKEKYQRSKDREYGYNDYNQEYKTEGGAYAGASRPSPLHVSNISYTDMTGDGYLSKDETIEMEGFITNTSSFPLEDVIIYINVDNVKHLTVSPPLTTTLRPGQKIRYTGRIHCGKARRGHDIVVSLNAKYGNKICSSENLLLRMK